MVKIVFRQRALDEMTSPERLDEAISAATPLSSLFVAVLLFALFVASAWAFAGTVTTRISGPALILFEGARNMQVTARGSGQVTEVLVAPGDVVERGAVLARVVNAPLRRRLEEAKRYLVELEAGVAEVRREQQKDLAEFARLQARRRAELENVVVRSEELVSTLRERLDNNVSLFERGIVGSAQVGQLRTELFHAQRELGSARSELTRLDLSREERESTWHERVRTAVQQASSQRSRVRELEIEASVTETVIASRPGEVVEVLVGEGSAVTPGSVVVTMTEPAARLSALAFVPTMDAKSVEVGMEVLVSPSTVRREEYGSMRAVVAEVSHFPMSSEALASLLQNADLVRTFTQSGPPILVRVDLLTDPATGAYVWTAGTPPPVAVTAGTLGTASIVVRAQRPAALVFPALRRLIGAS